MTGRKNEAQFNPKVLGKTSHKKNRFIPSNESYLWPVKEDMNMKVSTCLDQLHNNNGENGDNGNGTLMVEAPWGKCSAILYKEYISIHILWKI